MPGNPLTNPTWAAEAADAVERIVGTVRQKTTQPLVTATRGAVYGLLAGLLGVTAALLLLIAATRGLQALLDLGLSHSRAVYVSYLIVGGILCIAGLVALRKRFAPR